MGQDRARQLGEAVVVADRELAADLKEGFVPQARSVLSRQDQIVEATRAGAALLVQAIDRDVEGQGPMADAGDDVAQRVGDDEGLQVAARAAAGIVGAADRCGGVLSRLGRL